MVSEGQVFTYQRKEYVTAPDSTTNRTEFLTFTYSSVSYNLIENIKERVGSIYNLLRIFKPI